MNEVTYIVNTYNREEKLIIAIDSIIEQEGIEVKIIVVDDCSDKDIKDRIESLYGNQVQYTRNKKNLGLAKSRQIGLELAQTEFVAFLDDDDRLIDKSKTKRHLSILKSDEKLSLVCSNVKFIRGNEHSFSRIDFPNETYSHLLKRNGIIYPSTTTIRRSSMLSSGGFDFRFPRGIDSDVYRRILKNGYSIYFDDSPTIEYLLEADDKITNYKSYNGLKKDVISNSLVIYKYFFDFLKNPSALFFRTKVILKGLLLMLKFKVAK
ncbi:glycosyltransferase [Vibrio fluvialis]|nr:glycosyltransferase [Vibrio fluvialis]